MNEEMSAGAAVNPPPGSRARRRGLQRSLLARMGRRLDDLRLSLIALLQRIWRAIVALLSFVHAGCRRSVLAAADFLRHNALLRQLVGDVRRLILVIAFMATVIALVIETVYIVSFNSSAVVLRLGRYHRTVDSGIRFKLPVVERVFIVNSKSRLQEDFGFIQYTPPPKPLTEYEEEAASHQLEVVTEVAQSEIEARNSGNLQQELERGPPLPRDYVAAQNPPPPREPDPQAEAEEVVERVELQAEALENVIPPDGKVPVPEDMKMLTGDLNIVYVTWSVQYEIYGGEDYLFRAVDVQRVLRDIAVVAMRIAVGDRLDHEILSTGRDEIAEEAKLLMQETLDRYRLGLKITGVIIQDANPPDQVKDAFHLVNRAKQEMEDTINQAEAEYNSVLPQTYGKAERLLAEAGAYALELGNRSKGEAARFDAIREEYSKSPQVIRDRYYIEAMEDVYARTAVTLIDPQLKGILPLYSGRKPEQGSPMQPAAAAMAATALTPPAEPLEPVQGQTQVPHKPVPEVGLHTPPQRAVDPPRAQEVTPAAATAPEPTPPPPPAPAVNAVKPIDLPPGGSRRAP